MRRRSAYRGADLAVACGQFADRPWYPQPQCTGHDLGDQRVAFTDGVAVELKLIPLLHRDHHPAAGEPVQLVVGPPAPGQAPGW